ncbi:MAG: hypothetical protein II161_00220 [Erysipelotrichaceae bacterium]|nr:hypothetical protein [Erysipelotrichaceae bacterium]
MIMVIKERYVMAVIQQNMRWEENKYVEGTFILLFDDEVFLQETAEKGYGFMIFRHDLQDSQLHLLETNCPKTIAAHQKEIMSEIWLRVRAASDYMKSADYQAMQNLQQIARENLKSK